MSAVDQSQTQAQGTVATTATVPPPLSEALLQRLIQEAKEQERAAIEHATALDRRPDYMEPDLSGLKAQEEGKPLNLLNRLAAAIASVSGQIPELGKNRDQGYQYARVDDVVTVARKALAEHGIYTLVTPLREHFEEIQYTRSTGLRLTMTARVVVFSCDDPSDRMIWEMGAANNGSGDKGHQVMYSTFRKYMLLELLLLPRGGADDAEAQKDLEIAGRGGGSRPAQARQAGKGYEQRGGGDEGPPDAKLAGLVEMREYLAAAAHLAELCGKGGKVITTPQLNRLRTLARQAGWSTEHMDQQIRALLKVLPPKIPMDAYDAVVWYFSNVRPGDEWPWERCWKVIREEYSRSSWEPMGSEVAELACDHFKKTKGWTPAQIQVVLDSELGGFISDLPDKDHRLGKLVARVFERFEPKAVVGQYGPEGDPPAQPEAEEPPAPADDKEPGAEPGPPPVIPEGFESRTMGDLAKIAAGLGIMPKTGSGHKGKVTKADVVAALAKHQLDAAAVGEVAEEEQAT